jgi:hypothetical protein
MSSPRTWGRDVYVVAVVIAIVASPAFARSARKVQTQRPPPATYQGLYGGQTRFGIDPDPNIRFGELRQQNWGKGG